MSIDILNQLVSLSAQFGALAGVAALIAAGINLGKAGGVVKDGTAERWKAGLSLLGFVVIAALGIFKPDLTAVILDEQAAKLATVLVFITGFLFQTGLVPVAHKAFSGFPLIGTSFSRSRSVAGKEKANEHGQGMVEYALILVLVAVIVIAALTIMGPLIANVFSTVNQSLTLPENGFVPAGLQVARVLIRL